MMHMAQVAQYCLGLSTPASPDVVRYEVYFCPDPLLKQIAELLVIPSARFVLTWDSFVEAAKWCSVLAIALWLTRAQFAALRQCKETP